MRSSVRTSAGGPSATMRPASSRTHAIGVLRGEGEVVHRGHERQLGLVPELVEQLERLLLVTDVERGGRLVEDHDPRLLRERARDDRPAAARRR